MSAAFQLTYVLCFQMIWLIFLPGVLGCLTRVKPMPDHPFQGTVGHLKVNLSTCWNPCLFDIPLCHPLCPRHVIEEAEIEADIQQKKKKALDSLRLKLVRQDAKLRLHAR